MPRVRPTLTPLNLSPIKNNQPQTDVEKLLESIEKHKQILILAKDSNENIALKYQRYSDINTPEATAIMAPNNIDLPANHIRLGTDKGVIRSQYPTVEGLTAFKAMLAEKRITIVVVIADSNMLDHSQGKYRTEHPAYFANKENLKNYVSPPVNNIEIDCYQMPLKDGNNKTIPINFAHIKNWQDRTAFGKNEIRELAEIVTTLHQRALNNFQKQGSQAVKADVKTLPVIHCSAGVGRTGQLIAAMELINPDSRLSLESIIKTLREEGNPNMVQTSAQLDVLIDLAEDLKKPLLAKYE
ncbi:protein-tyrosine phosphatase family protein [Yersinia hibernica]|uniref:protein-tyrosine-phosphatase n=2 Tax=Yersinia hibernica TaxID=2339259 RepID=A0ABX5R7S4_9GAMM|nr:protein-tyrosine phosphatase family protein [Yersinia hibernica]QAX81240.1 protein-tyrosine-phosphatase [Yersinia hibernica]